MQINIHEAKSNLSQLIQSALSGEEVIIAKAGTPLVKMVAIPTKKIRHPGALKGKITLADDVLLQEDTELTALFEQGL
ncbi:type II toxin-antitoxin system prevent-host-death family antitoxin [Testudinibacter sp. TR-2022]|uniref:type II toxin-antitoxin system Phd/YefM family antitoxin n=1 Tax=Testudinibacter sp. TR-2022 TaxID=2585029 RepID=UPI0011187431|nr:type II toxin-antitoxin system prevent-host-death family antitoxin [Testudinibacter sp. TR-2022]TNH04672.1 type II toxin-antitoxin system prevent-host-death family antitoxin [Pasteurellaceae bacterium Phil31]TNH10125.1 type II toxin-antitoxin system prevent-host-death family antitoxin [Testudinibacter sp. TR-2022]TNH12526.1 type II toxin-antitoxin system prevent-host-death family antitoxin [Testudinibacter sp. TR-2022]TNH15549.1 type II toxin-antitoxin system prevent-host-death family antito